MASKEGMIRYPVDIENVTLEVNLDLDNDEVAIGGVTAAGVRILYKAIDDGTGKGLFPVTIVGPAPAPSPGTVIGPTPADTVIGIGATVALPAIPAGTRRMTIQNTGPAMTMIRVREVGGVAGAGIILVRFASITLGGNDGALAAMEAEEVAGVATTATVLFERT